jgi:hypothetical protein
MRWRRSNTTGFLFLLEAGHKTLGTVFRWPDGAYGWKAGGVASVDDGHYANEDAAIAALWDAIERLNEVQTENCE